MRSTPRGFDKRLSFSYFYLIGLSFFFIHFISFLISNFSRLDNYLLPLFFLLYFLKNNSINNLLIIFLFKKTNILIFFIKFKYHFINSSLFNYENPIPLAAAAGFDKRLSF